MANYFLWRHRRFNEYSPTMNVGPTILAKTTDYTLIILPDDYVPNQKP